MAAHIAMAARVEAAVGREGAAGLRSGAVAACAMCPTNHPRTRRELHEGDSKRLSCGGSTEGRDLSGGQQ